MRLPGIQLLPTARSRRIGNCQPRGSAERFAIPMERTGTVSRHGPRSSSVTARPASASRAALTEPPKPLPITTMSMPLIMISLHLGSAS